MFAVFGRDLGAPSLFISSLSFFGHSRPKKASHSPVSRPRRSCAGTPQQPHSFYSFSVTQGWTQEMLNLRKKRGLVGELYWRLQSLEEQLPLRYYSCFYKRRKYWIRHLLLWHQHVCVCLWRLFLTILVSHSFLKWPNVSTLLASGKKMMPCFTTWEDTHTPTLLTGVCGHVYLCVVCACLLLRVCAFVKLPALTQ